MKTLEKIGIIILVILIGLLSFTLFLVVRTLNELDKDERTFNYSHTTFGKVEPSEVYMFSYR